MNLIDQVKQIKIDHPDWGRRKISAELGVSEKRVRMVLESLRTPNENGIRSIRHYNQQSIIDAVVHLKDVNDRDEILRAVKLDPAKWDCIDALVKAWQMGSKDASGKPQVTDLYSVSVKARPKQGFDLGACIERINSIGIKPVEVVPDKNVGRKGLLEVFLTDMHFGVNTLEDYTDTLQAVISLLDGHDTLVLVTGSDNLHTNGHKGQTVNGTQLEQVDLNQAFNDAVEFYTAILTSALKYGMNAKTVHVPANHDYDTSFFVAKTLERLLPQADIDADMGQYKAMRYGQVAIGWTHGDEGRNFDRVFMREFPAIFGTADAIEVHSGHIHMETVQDQSGVLVRTLPTGTKRTDWTKRKGYHSVRRFQVFSYTEDGLRAIYYV